MGGELHRRGDTAYTFARSHQNTAFAMVRIDATFTPKLSLQFYAQPYISEGQYENWRALANPRASDYATQFAPFVPGLRPRGALPTVAGYNFNYQQLNVNTVLRWEYRRGSALYLVWTHGRSFYNQDQQYTGLQSGHGREQPLLRPPDEHLPDQGDVLDKPVARDTWGRAQAEREGAVELAAPSCIRESPR